MPRLKGKTYTERRTSKDAVAYQRFLKRRQPDKKPRNLVDILSDEDQTNAR
jgi:hypothetical protein